MMGPRVGSKMVRSMLEGWGGHGAVYAGGEKQEAALDAHFGARRDPARKLDRFFGDAPESDFRKRTSPFDVKKRMDPDVTGERREVRHSQNHQKSVSVSQATRGSRGRNARSGTFAGVKICL